MALDYRGASKIFAHRFAAHWHIARSKQLDNQPKRPYTMLILTLGLAMKLTVYNTQYDRKDAYFFAVEEFHYYEGEPVTVKWAGPHELAIRTDDSVGLRIIQRKNIREIDGVPYTYTEGLNKSVTRIVAGSKGASYQVAVGPDGKSCTCPGFTFRGKCKHVEAVEKDMA